LHFIVGPYVFILYNVFRSNEKIAFKALFLMNYCSPEVNFYDFHEISVNLFCLATSDVITVCYNSHFCSIVLLQACSRADVKDIPSLGAIYRAAETERTHRAIY